MQGSSPKSSLGQSIHPWKSSMKVIHDSPIQPNRDCKPFLACFNNVQSLTHLVLKMLMHLKTVLVVHLLKPFMCLFSVNFLKLGDQNQEFSHYTSSSVTIRFKKIVLTSFCLGFGFCESVGFSVLEISCTKILSIHTCHKTAATEHSSRKISIFS